MVLTGGLLIWLQSGGSWVAWEVVPALMYLSCVSATVAEGGRASLPGGLPADQLGPPHSVVLSGWLHYNTVASFPRKQV